MTCGHRKKSLQLRVIPWCQRLWLSMKTYLQQSNFVLVLVYKIPLFPLLLIILILLVFYVCTRVHLNACTNEKFKNLPMGHTSIQCNSKFQLYRWSENSQRPCIQVKTVSSKLKKAVASYNNNNTTKLPSIDFPNTFIVEEAVDVKSRSQTNALLTATSLFMWSESWLMLCTGCSTVQMKWPCWNVTVAWQSQFKLAAH